MASQHYSVGTSKVVVPIWVNPTEEYFELGIVLGQPTLVCINIGRLQSNIEILQLFPPQFNSLTDLTSLHAKHLFAS